jgi:hypothetical protein
LVSNFEDELLSKPRIIRLAGKTEKCYVSVLDEVKTVVLVFKFLGFSGLDFLFFEQIEAKLLKIACCIRILCQDYIFSSYADVKNAHFYII